MNRANWLALGVAVLCAFGVAGCVAGAVIEPAAFLRAWLCSYLLWLGVPIAGVTLILVHDLSGGDWIATARPALEAAAITMPLATLAGIPAFVGLNSLYSWTHPPSDLGNIFYLNPAAFFIRYGVYVVLWNLLAAFALWGPREGGQPIAPGLSWISALGLVILAFSTSFAAIDWILSLEPKFWSSIFPYTQTSSWFNTGMALVLLSVACFGLPSAERTRHMADMAKILLATTIFWGYVEFMQILIIWEEDLKTEIPWYLKRLDSAWHPAIYVSAALGFMIPFLVLLWGPTKRNRTVVGAICVSILLSRIANTWLLVIPEFDQPAPFWLDVASVVALGAGILLLFVFALTLRGRWAAHGPAVTVDHA